MRHILFIYNPVAGTGKIRKNLFEIVEYYNSRECIVTVCPVKELEKFYTFEQSWDEKYDLIVCCGGDGTLNILVSFMIRNKIEMELGYIPSGSTNDYACSLGIPRDFRAALECTLCQNKKTIDVGMFNDRYFLYVAAFGIFTKASYSTSQKAKNILGHTAYILEGIRQISDLKYYNAKIEVREEIIEDDFILGLVTNSLSIGGFKKLLPRDISMDDGEFEVVLIKRPANIIELHSIMTALLNEKLNENRHIYYRKTKKLSICFTEEVAWSLDGEYGGSGKKAEISIKPRALTMNCN